MRTTACLATVAVLALCGPSVVVSQEAVFPILVITDAEGDPIGPVIGISTTEETPVIRFVDPSKNVPLLLRVQGKSVLRAHHNTTYFADDNCAVSSSSRYHGESNTNLGALSGYSYSVARIAGGPQRLYRSDLSVAAPMTPYKSFYQSHVDACNDMDGMTNLRPVTHVMNMDSEFPPDYVLQSP